MKKQENKSKIKIQNIIIVINIVILLAITCFYAYRLIHFYRIENPKIDKQITLSEAITMKKNITSIGDGLYKKKDTYTYKGKEVNNYLEYSGYLFRIISVDEDDNVKVITDDAITNLAWGIDDNYEKSYIKTWLTGENEHEGIFYNSLNNALNYLVDTSFCTETVDEDVKKCKDNTTDKVGLLSLDEYKEVGGSKSYLNKDNYWWLSNPSEDGIWYVYSDGKINDVSNSGNEYYSYGVRPVITIKGDTKLISGDGTLKNPYTIEKDTGNMLKDKSVGKYIKYSDLTWRIIEKNDSYVRVALDGFIKEDNEDYERVYSNNLTTYSSTNAIGYYLNYMFYETLDHSYMVDGTIYTNRYDSTVDFNYLKLFSSSITAKVGMMQVGDLFMNDYSDYFLVSRTSTYVGTVYRVLEDNKLYADLPTSKAKIRPTIFLDLDSPIKSGSGSKEKPYVIGDIDEEK